MRRRRDRIAKLLLLNAGLLGVLIVLQGIKLNRQGDGETTETVSAQQSSEGSFERPSVGTRQRDAGNTRAVKEPLVAMTSNPVEAYLRSAMAPIRTAAADHGLSEKGLLPTDKAVAAAIATGSYDSDATQSVLATLRSAYSEFNMPFPDPTLSFPVEGRGDGAVAGVASGDIIGAFFQVTANRLSRAAEAAGDDPQSVLPSSADLARAARTGALDSDVSIQVMKQLREGYATYDLRFPDPADALAQP